MTEKEKITESHEKIKNEYLDNIENPKHNWVALNSKINLLYDNAITILDSEDEELKEIENTKNALDKK